MGGEARTAVLGAGLAGCTAALGLARAGHPVVLIDRAARPMLGASRHNEGKLHLGYVYAAASNEQTHRLLAGASLRFLGQLEELTGYSRDRFAVSPPFSYVVPADSQLSVAAVDEHFRRIDDLVAELCESYGHPPVAAIEPATEAYRRAHYSDSVQAAFLTSEVAVDPARAADLVAAAVLADPMIEFRGGHEVVGADVTRTGHRVTLDADGVQTSVECAGVVNASWEQRVRLDRMVGLESPLRWSLRWRATVTIDDVVVAAPATTAIIGPYGDLVNYDSGRAYVSWYPSCRLLMTTEEQSPAPVLDEGMRDEIRRSTVDGLASLIPAVAALQDLGDRTSVGGGFIVAVGASDIDDPESALHDRHQIGVESSGRWISVSTGKYCTAPTFGIRAAEQLDEALRS